MNKYENYYPIYSCFEDKNICLLKEGSICSYCYSCYVEICNTFSAVFQLEERTYDIEYIKNKIELKLNDKSTYYINRLEESIEYIVDILNKYTRYSKVEKKGYNLLHISFIENLIMSIGSLLNVYYLNEETKVKFNTADEKIKSFVFYKLNIICFEVYCNYHYKTYRIHNSIIKLYTLKSLEKNKFN